MRADGRLLYERWWLDERYRYGEANASGLVDRSGINGRKTATDGALGLQTGGSIVLGFPWSEDQGLHAQDKDQGLHPQDGVGGAGARPLLVP